MRGIKIALCVCTACIMLAGCGANPSSSGKPAPGQSARFEIGPKETVSSERDCEIRIIRDRQTGQEYLLYREWKGRAPAICPLVSESARPTDATPQVSRGGSHTLHVVATGYTAGPESTGKSPGDVGYGVTKSGLPAARGICAVDTAVIPFGTVLYVPGYGYAVAGDIGGAVKGNRIDLFFPTPDEARAWGVREVRAVLVKD